jgi:phospholipid/cholesterol/gamma-HCH transport system permease protein
MGIRPREIEKQEIDPLRDELTLHHSLLSDGTLEILLSGHFTVHAGFSPFSSITTIVQKSSASRLRLNVDGLVYVDSSWIAFLVSLRGFCQNRQILLELIGEPPNIQGLRKMLDMDALDSTARAEPAKSSGVLVRVGEQTIDIFQHGYFILMFVGEIALAVFSALRNPRRIRLGDLLTAFQRNGVNALPIITLINFLVGVVLAFQASIQLSQFGANIYVANLVGVAQTREFGPMITAIILAGRSGSAFAAEIGSMKVNEEVDALTTMGLDPVRFLVIPKMLALCLALPVLTFYADFMGILGGIVVAVTGLDLTVQGYLIQTQKAVGLFDVFSGVTKSFAFAFIISGIGCLRGFQTQGGADSVGQSATSAVVSGIFLIILVDAIFTVIFQYV